MGILVIVKNDITGAALELGISDGDILLTHSSLKSLGYVDGGPYGVIEGLYAALQPNGTLVMPTLSQINFETVYADWHLDRRSDVGLITETFRKMPGVLRSDQETHSVAALGPLAQEITSGHKSSGPRYGVFGDYAFSHSSPWQKMYDKGAKIIFIGVSMRSNTFKHFVEYKLVENLLDSIYDDAKRLELKSKLLYHGIKNGRDVVWGSIWPFYDALKMQEALEQNNMVKKTVCKDTALLCVDAIKSCDFAYSLIMENFSNWFDGEVLNWLEECRKHSNLQH